MHLKNLWSFFSSARLYSSFYLKWKCISGIIFRKVPKSAGLLDIYMPHLFSYQKSQTWYILRGLEIEKKITNHGNLVFNYLAYVYCISSHFGVFYKGKCYHPRNRHFLLVCLLVTIISLVPHTYMYICRLCR
jgi:hypothetical protein